MAGLALAVLATPAAACEDAALARLAEEPLPASVSRTLDVSEWQSAEGGQWEIYLKDGRALPAAIVRTDYGEMGRVENRLLIAAPERYAVVTITYHYTAPIAVEGSTVARTERKSFLFCNGPISADARDAFQVFESDDVRGYVSALKR